MNPFNRRQKTIKISVILPALAAGLARFGLKTFRMVLIILALPFWLFKKTYNYLLIFLRRFYAIEIVVSIQFIYTLEVVSLFKPK